MKVTKIGPNGLKLIKEFEGLVLKPYKCAAGVWTIGYGNTFYADGRKVQPTDQPITQQVADELLLKTLSSFERRVDSMVLDDINQNQFDALVSFAFNCGTQNLLKSTLLKKINVNPNNITIRDEFMKWTRVNGKVLKGLERRRKAEADLYFTK